MGFYFRKSINIGPLRFNLSKSGLGISTGIPGLRIGSGPRGSYIHVGRDGLYYRQALTLNKHLVRSEPSNKLEQSLHQGQDSTTGQLTRLGSAYVTQMLDSTAPDILADIAEKRTRTEFLPYVLAGFLFLLLVIILFSGPRWLAVIWLASLPIATFVTYQIDKLRTNAILMFDLDAPSEDAFAKLHEAIETLAQCAGLWSISTQGDVHDPRYHAGAGSLISRSRMSIRFQPPAFIKCNVSVPELKFATTTLYLFPDQLLVCDSAQVAAINYNDVAFGSRIRRFIEDEELPRDCKVVDYTWRFVNKNGEPDRRFNDNIRLPICEYEETELTSESGFHEIIQSSTHGIADLLRDSFRTFGQAIEDTRKFSKDMLGAPPRAKDVSANPKRFHLPYTDKDRRLDTTIGNHHYRLFKLLYCIAAADGRLTENEKAKINEILKKTRSEWGENEIDQLLSNSLSEIEAKGLECFTSDAIEGLMAIRNQKQVTIIMRCVDLMFQAKGALSDEESA